MTIPYWNTNMELRHLESFVETVRQQGFSAAAGVLGSTQSTVSKSVKQLEHDCGAVLLDRLPTGVRLTEAGEWVFRRAISMLAERDHLLAELDALRGVERGRLRLGLPALGSSVLFAPLVAEYHHRYPGIEIELIEQGSKRLEEMVRGGEIEMGATLAPAPAEMEWRPIVDEPLVALLPRDHPLADRESIRFRELAKSPFIVFERGFVLNSMLRAASRKLGIRLTEAARGATADFIIALVSSGMGVSVLPRLEVESRGKLSLATALLDEKDLRWNLGLIWRAGSTLSPAARHWLDLVAERR